MLKVPAYIVTFIRMLQLLHRWVGCCYIENHEAQRLRNVNKDLENESLSCNTEILILMALF